MLLTMAHTLIYIFLPLLVLAAFRLDRRELAAAVVLVSGMALWGTLRGRGPFQENTLNASILELQGFIAVLSLTALAVSASVAERRRAEMALRAARDELEVRIEERAAHLPHAYEEIRAQETRYQILYNETPVMLHSMDSQGRILTASRFWFEHLGYTRADVIGRQFADFIVPDDGTWTSEEQVFWLHGEVKDLPMKLRRRDGSILDVLLSLATERASGLTGERYLAVIIDVTQRKKAEEALRASEEKFYRAFHFSPDAVSLSLAVDGRFLEINEGFSRILGFSREEVLGRTSFEIGIWPDPGERERVMRQLLADDTISNVEVSMRHKSGETVTALISAGILILDGKTTLLLVARDISDRKKAMQEINNRNRELETLYQISSIALAVGSREAPFQEIAEEICLATGFPAVGIEAWDDTRQIMSLKAATGVPAWRKGRFLESPLGQTPSERVIRSGHPVVLRAEDPDASLSADFYGLSGLRTYVGVPLIIGRRILGALSLGHTDDVRPDKPWLQWVTSLANTLASTLERGRADEQIEYMAYHDSLTGLPNRPLFRDRLELAIVHARRGRKLLGVLFLDLDRFKVVNDSLGHGIGDLMLKGVAQRLARSVREGDTVARLGGDEFIILLSELTHAEDVGQVAGKLRDNMRQPIQVAGQEIFTSASIGACVYPGDGEDVDTLLKHADAAMYRAKSLGGNGYQLYKPTMNRRAVTRLGLEADLHRAVENREFLVYYQPEIDLKAEEIVGMEALVRWRHPQRGILLPATFIPVAEETGLIVPIGLMVLRDACEMIRHCQDAGYRRLRVAVNLSLRQFQHPQMVRQIEQVLQETGCDPAWLDLEITESVAMETVRRRAPILRDLKQLGLHMSLDDFGQGYSSLNHLKRLPISTVKIDRAFVRRTTRDPRDAAIARAIITMAHSLSLRVVAEGVENCAQRDFFRREDCDSMQGFFYSRPIPAKRFHKLLRRSGEMARVSQLESTES